MRDKHWVSILTRQRDNTVNAKGQVTRRSAFFQRTLQQIQNKLIKKTPKDDDEWNVLNIVQWVPKPYPPFLNTPNSDILHRLDALEATGAAPAPVLSGRNIEFMLLSQGGNHTASHVDDFALGIFFTFYMPPGTIHYIFRKLSVPTLITGGKVLTWTGLRRWLCLLKQQELSEAELAVAEKKTGDWVACLIKIVKHRHEAQDWDNMLGGREELELVMNTLEVGSAVTLAAELLTWAEQRWNEFEAMDEFFAFQRWDQNDFW
ncbi:hypothetical protein FPANT_14062 [Fusarium pseudoanthophilum]|uniref:JmjC domain-containing protein n=1 Tax=Fusarium pseudoanthophilum TaxID=48495 RepID=A0A8H5K663_9HYPO|nr:hypothetical protein FPANT_14062 [Fusarium pseudoanthophilum]